MKKQIEQIIKDYIKDEKENIEFTKKILPKLEKFEGQRISKRIETHLKNEFPDLNVYFSTIASMTYLVFRKMQGHNEAWEKRYFLAYDNDYVYTKTAFETHNAAFLSAAQERIDKLEPFLKSKKQIEVLTKAIQNYNAAVKTIKESFNSFDFPAYHQIMKALKTTEEV